MTSPTFKACGSASFATTAVTISRSVSTPTGIRSGFTSPASTTTSRPTCFSRMRRAAAATVSPGVTVTTSVLHMFPTIMVRTPACRAARVLQRRYSHWRKYPNPHLYLPPCGIGVWARRLDSCTMELVLSAPGAVRERNPSDVQPYPCERVDVYVGAPTVTVGKRCKELTDAIHCPLGRDAEQDRRLLACRQLPVRRTDLPLRQP